MNATLQALTLLAPVPTAWAVYSNVLLVFGWPWPVAAAAAITVEGTGWASISMALRLYSYNRTKRKSDPAAPLWLAGAAVAGYVAIVLLLVVLLGLFQERVVRAPWLPPVIEGVFVLLSLVGGLLTALGVDHRQRLTDIAADKARRRGQVADKRRTRADKGGQVSGQGGQALGQGGQVSGQDGQLAKQGGQVSGQVSGQMDKLSALSALLSKWPEMDNRQLAKALGVSERTIRRYKKRLGA